MFNKAIIPALLVGGLGIAVAGCAGELFGQPIFGYVEPKKQTVKPKTEAVEPKTVPVISRGYNKPQTRAEELDKYCANMTRGFITVYVEVRGQRLSCEQYVTLRAQGWPATETETETETETDRPAKTFTVDKTIEKIIRLKNAGVGDEVIIQLLQSGRGNLPR